MTEKKLQASLVVSDPWEFGEGPFEGHVLEIENNEADKLLLHLTSLIQFESQQCEYFVVRPREDLSNFITLLEQGKKINCNLTMIPKKRALGPNPLDISWWRGGVVALLLSVL